MVMLILSGALQSSGPNFVKDSVMNLKAKKKADRRNFSFFLVKFFCEGKTVHGAAR